MKTNKQNIIPFLIIFLFAATFLAMGYFDMILNRPANSLQQVKKIEIPRGYSLKKIANLLKKENLVGNHSTFVILTHLRGVTNQLKAGEYLLSTNMTPLEIMEKLFKGDVITYSLTIPEGYTIKEIANLLEENKLLDKERFTALAQSRKTLDSLGIKAKSLEGYLFPDTYHFPKGTKEEEIIKKMAEKLNNLFTEDIKKRLEEINFSKHEILTLASLIEKEARIDSERKLISAVFHNRLKRKMLLQSDPTVIYALKDFDGNIRKKDMKIDSPYNTYVYRGLPPAPIANPGKDSILAALYPAEVDYLYFVAKNNGEHYFSSNFKEHNKAVRKYQLKR
jgi:UPF0755 protein